MEVKQKYNDAVSFKLHNRRVTVIYDEELNGWYVELRVADKDLSPRSLHKVLKGKVVQTTIKLSDRTARAMVQAFIDQMKPIDYDKEKDKQQTKL